MNHSARVEVPGISPASFKLAEKAEDSFDLFHSSRKIGTARREERGQYSARFEGAGTKWKATAKSPGELLDLIGTFLLAQQARGSEQKARGPTPEITESDIPVVERKLGKKWAELLEKQRVARLDELIAGCRKRIEPLGERAARNTKQGAAKRT
jgi:hypothetical protein